MDELRPRRCNPAAGWPCWRGACATTPQLGWLGRGRERRKDRRSSGNRQTVSFGASLGEPGHSAGHEEDGGGHLDLRPLVVPDHLLEAAAELVPPDELCLGPAVGLALATCGGWQTSGGGVDIGCLWRNCGKLRKLWENFGYQYPPRKAGAGWGRILRQPSATQLPVFKQGYGRAILVIICHTLIHFSRRHCT